MTYILQLNILNLVYGILTICFIYFVVYQLFMRCYKMRFSIGVAACAGLKKDSHRVVLLIMQNAV